MANLTYQIGDTLTSGQMIYLHFAISENALKRATALIRDEFTPAFQRIAASINRTVATLDLINITHAPPVSYESAAQIALGETK